MFLYQTVKAYLQVDFDNYMTKLVAQNIRTYEYVMKTSLDKWARFHFSGKMYNIMTMNIAECMNIILQDAKSLLIVLLLESIRFLIQD